MRLCSVRRCCGAKDIWRPHDGAISVAHVSAVLIAEPQSDVRGFLERHLAQDGFDVVGTHDGDAALELALRAHPDLVLLGDATAVESFRGVPVIVIGGEDSDAIDRVEPLHAAATTSLHDPSSTTSSWRGSTPCCAARGLHSATALRRGGSGSSTRRGA